MFFNSTGGNTPAQLRLIRPVKIKVFINNILWARLYTVLQVDD